MKSLGIEVKSGSIVIITRIYYRIMAIIRYKYGNEIMSKGKRDYLFGLAGVKEERGKYFNFIGNNSSVKCLNWIIVS